MSAAGSSFAPVPIESGVWLPARSLWWRELVRFIRQPSRVVGAVGSPLIFWLVIGSGMGTSFRPASAPADANYLQYFFPGTMALIVLFTAIFSTFSLIQDRHEGFLQAVLVAPIPRLSLVLGKVLGGTTLAVVQAMLFCLCAPLIGIELGWQGLAGTLVVLTLISFGITSLGFLAAWWLDSTQGFHSIMNLVLIPMWLLSGALFPAEGAPIWLRAVIWANPLTYNVAALRHVLNPAVILDSAHVPSLPVALGVSLAGSVLIFLAAIHWGPGREGSTRVWRN